MMKINKKVSFHKAITTSREFFKEGTGIKCVHYGDIYKNYSGKKVCSSNIINSFANPVAAEKNLILRFYHCSGCNRNCF